MCAFGSGTAHVHVHDLQEGYIGQDSYLQCEEHSSDRLNKQTSAREPRWPLPQALRVDLAAQTPVLPIHFHL